MTHAAWYLLTRSAGNWAAGLLRRLRSPRYLVAVLFGVAYLTLAFAGQRRGAGGSVPPELVLPAGTLVLAILLAKWWLFGADRLALAFTPAEVQFLFPAPVSRSALLAYKLVRVQRLVILNVLVWALLVRQGDGRGPGGLAYALGLWTFFSTAAFHRLGVALTRDTVLKHGRSGVRRAWPALTVLAVAVGCLWVTLERIPSSLLRTNPNGPLGAIETVLDTAPLAWLVWPLRIPLLPLAAETTREWVVALAAALALAALHVAWIVRADRRFEEAAVEASARRAELLERWRKRGTTATPSPGSARRWFPLAASGHPVGAIVWKNLTRLARTVSPALVLTLAVLLGAGMVFILLRGSDPQLSRAIPVLAIGWAAVLAIFGPQWVRVDIRGDLDHIVSLKTWPLSGLVVMTGQVLSSAAVLTVLQAGLIGLGVAGAVADGSLSVSSRLLLGGTLPVLLLLGALNVVSLCIQNGAAVLYPDWVRTEIRPGGIEQMGQHLLTAGASFLLLLLASTGPAVAGATTSYLLWPVAGPWALLPGMLIGAAGLALEAFLLLDWVGRLFDRLDPSQT